MRTCDNCRGAGLAPTECVMCSVCYGSKCIQCNETGYLSMPFEECKKCKGTGTVCAEPHETKERIARIRDFPSPKQIKIN